MIFYGSGKYIAISVENGETERCAALRTARFERKSNRIFNGIVYIFVTLVKRLGQVIKVGGAPRALFLQKACLYYICFCIRVKIKNIGGTAVS